MWDYRRVCNFPHHRPRGTETPMIRAILVQRNETSTLFFHPRTFTSTASSSTEFLPSSFLASASPSTIGYSFWINFLVPSEIFLLHILQCRIFDDKGWSSAFLHRKDFALLSTKWTKNS